MCALRTDVIIKTAACAPSDRNAPASFLNTAILIWIITGAYLEIPLPLGHFYIPGAMLVLAMPLLAVALYRRIHRNDILFFLAIVSLTVLSIFLSPGFEFIGDKLKSSSQLLFSCCLMLLVVKLCATVGSKRLFWCFAISVFIIATGLLLEFLFAGVKQIFGDVRDVFYAAENTGFNYSLYDNLMRDISIVGRDRATFLTTEPSVAAEGVFILANCCVILRQTPITIGLFAFVNFAALYTTGSPIVPASLICGALTLVSFDLWRKPVVLAVGITFLTIGLAVPQVREIISKQIERFDGGVDELGEQSIYSRIGFPYSKALPTVLTRSPVFGVGVGGKKILVEWSDDARADLSDEFSVGTNAFVRIFLFYGLAGGVLFFVAVSIYLKRAHVGHLVLLAVIWGFYANTTGALESPRFWTYSAFLIAAFGSAPKHLIRGKVHKQISTAPLPNTA